MANKTKLYKQHLWKEIMNFPKRKVKAKQLSKEIEKIKKEI